MRMLECDIEIFPCLSKNFDALFSNTFFLWDFYDWKWTIIGRRSWNCYKDWSEPLQQGLGIGRWPPGFDAQRWNGSNKCDRWESFAARNCVSRVGLHKTLTCSMYFDEASEAIRSPKYHHLFKLFVGVHSRHTSEFSQNIPVFWGENAHEWEKSIDHISINAYPTFAQIYTLLSSPNQMLFLDLNTVIHDYRHELEMKSFFHVFQIM